MKLSIIIPMYNSCSNVLQTLAHLNDQSIRGNYQDLDVIVIDDGSTDEAHSAVGQACDFYGFRYYRQDNAGGAAACNRGLSMVSGEYFTFIDADDCITNDYLDIIFREISSGELDFIAHRWTLENGVVGDQHERPLINWNVWSNVYRTSLFRAVKFDEDIIFAWDIEWLRRLPFTDHTVIFKSLEFTNIYNSTNPESTTNKFYRGEIPARKSDTKGHS